MPASQTTASGDRGAPRARRGSSRGRGRGGRATSNPFSGPVTRGRGTTSQRFDTPSTTQNQVHNAPRSRGRGRGRVAPAAAPSTFSSPFQQAASTSSAQTLEHEIIRDLDMAAVKTRRDQLRKTMEVDRRRYIEQGLMADPDKPTTLDHAITPVGTCTEMCPENERVDRMYEMQFELAESAPSPTSGRRVPIESRMVKKFRRAAAGIEEQLPSELRTPETLKRTLDYLVDKIVGGEDRLALHHKFVWDRTRAIRNDFSIQQVTQPNDVAIAVDCFERIARFHILSLHHLSDPDNLDADDFFDAQQEREQLSKTLQSLEYYYNDHRGVVEFPNESEFKAYGALFELLSQTPDLEDRIAHWPAEFQNDPRTQTMIKIYNAAGETEFEQGPLRPPTPYSLAQSNTARFWRLLASKQVSYLMACVAEINFATVRFTALQHLWRSGKNAAPTQQKLFKGLTIDAVTKHLGFDTKDETRDFCQSFGVHFVAASDQPDHLDFTSQASKDLDKSIVFKTKQVLSRHIVEKKRHLRTLPAIINGISVADAIEYGLVEDGDEQEDQYEVEPRTAQDDDQSMFFPDEDEEAVPQRSAAVSSNPFTKPLNPAAASFTPKDSVSTVSTGSSPQSPAWLTNFGSKDKEVLASSIFAPQKQEATLSTMSATPGLGGARSSLPSFFPANTQTTTPFSFGSAGVASAETTTKPAFSSLNQKFVDNKPLFQSSTSPSDQVTPGFVFNSQTDSPRQSIATPAQRADNSLDSTTGTHFAQPQTVWKSDTGIPPLANSEEVASEPPASGLNTFILPRPTLPNSGPEQSTVETKPETPLFSLNKPAPIQAQSTFPASVFQTQADDKSTTPLTSPAKPVFSAFKATSSDSTTAASLPPLNKTTTTAITRHQKTTHTPIKPSKTELTKQMARIAMTQNEGIMDMYIQHTLAHVLEETFAKFESDRFKDRLNQLRKTVIMRKFVGLWRAATERKRLQKRVDRRRRMLVANVKAASELKKRKEEELEDVLSARRMLDRAQNEARMERVREETGQAREADAFEQAAISETMPPPAQIAGRKRKILTSSTSNRPVYTTPVANHKRSKTLSTDSIDQMARRTPVSTSHSMSLRRSVSQSHLRKSLGIEKKLDHTTTDYFKLKALGVEVGEEKKFAERQKKRDDDLQQMRASLSARSTPEPHASRTLQQRPAQRVDSPQFNTAQPASTAKNTETDDPLLAQLRQARLELASNTDWLHGENARLEQEVKKEEDLRRSLSSAHSRSTSFAVSTNGFARSVSGYEYLPPSIQPGLILSRTEERIRRTGARGLATKPIRPRKLVDEYLPVPMSRKTAREFNQAQKRSLSKSDESEPPRRTSSEGIGSLQNGLTTSKRPRQEDQTSMSRLAALSASYDEADEDEVEQDEEGELDLEQYGQSDGQQDMMDGYSDEEGGDPDYIANGSRYINVNTNGCAAEEEKTVQSGEQYEEYEDEEYEQAEQDEDEDEDENEDQDVDYDADSKHKESSHGYKYPVYQREQSTQSGSQAVSTPQSGPGATEDDPFELSD